MATMLSKEERYANNREIGIINLRNSRLVYKKHSCNLAGNPEKGYRGSTQRFCNVSIEEDIAKRIMKYGVDVKQTKPYGDEDEFEPEYFVKCIATFRDREDDIRNPRFYLVVNGRKQELKRDELREIDDAIISRVSVSLSPYTREDGGVTLYIRHFYAEMYADEDPFAEDYEDDPGYEEEEMPFV